MPSLISNYATLVIKKIQFHHQHNEFEGSLSLDTYAANLKLKNIQIKIGEGLIRYFIHLFIILTSPSKDTVKELFNLQKMALAVPNFIFSEPQDEIKLHCLPTMVEGKLILI
jgi:hypothetical protein